MTKTLSEGPPYCAHCGCGHVMSAASHEMLMTLEFEHEMAHGTSIVTEEQAAKEHEEDAANQ